MHKTYPYISIIVPVYNNNESLFNLMKAISAQTYPQEKTEIIIVNNKADTEIGFIHTEYPFVKIIQEIHPGSYKARNTGVKYSTTELIAFTDSDCIPSETWIERGVKALINNPECAIIGGQTNLVFENDNHPNIFELYDKTVYFNNKDFIESLNFSMTANMFVRKKAFEIAGLFDDTLKSGGDKEWGDRAFKAGLKIAYAEDSVVFHPSRNTLKKAYYREIRVTGGLYDQSSAHERFFKIVSCIIPPVKRFLRIIKKEKMSAVDKTKLFLLLTLFKTLGSLETIRLSMGGNSKNT